MDNVYKYKKECYCCKEIKQCRVISSTSDGKGEPRLVCERCYKLKKDNPNEN